MKVTLTIVEVFDKWSFKNQKNEEVTLYPFEVKEIKAVNGHHGYEFNSSKPIPKDAKKATAEIIATGSNQFAFRNWEFI